MLIDWQKQELVIKEFKKIVDKLEWKVVTRTLAGKQETFYNGYLEDDIKKIEVLIRPSKKMQVNETFKYKRFDGTNPTDKQVADFKKAEAEGRPIPSNSRLVEYGCTAYIQVDDKFINKLKSIAKAPQKTKLKTMSW